MALEMLTKRVYVIILCCAFVLLVQCSMDTSSCQWHWLSERNTTAKFDCRSRHLTTLPTAIFSDEVVDLDLSMNQILSLAGGAFKGLVRLIRLNISQSGIKQLSATTFEGLVHLEELDMKNNPVLATGLPPGIFNYLPHLRRLQISGFVTKDATLSLYGTLRRLEEIAITPNLGDMPYSLTKLGQLRAVHFAFCRGGHKLTKALLRPFTRIRIEEIAFFRCDLRYVDSDTFDGFSSLKSVNLAANRELDFDNVIDALSSSQGVAVSTLILDMLRSNSSVLGRPDHRRCRNAWKHITNLSIRGIGFNDIERRFLHCLRHVSRLAAGFNPFVVPGRMLLQFAVSLWNNLKYADFSYMRFVDKQPLKRMVGFDVLENLILMNNDYFKPPMGTFYDWDIANNQSEHQPLVGDNCTGLSIPSHLIYFRYDHSVQFLDSDSRHTCYKIFPNNARYIDLSYSRTMIHINITFSPKVYGLSKLEVLKLAGMYLYDINWATLQYCPSLRILRLEENSLGLGPLKRLPKAPRLEELDFSSNYVRKFPNDMFAELMSLRRLSIARNELTSLDAQLPDRLEYLDISGNMLTSLDANTRATLDHLPALVLRIDDNRFFCDCEAVGWVVWYQKTEIQIGNKQLITCKHHTGHHTLVDADVEHLRLSCGSTVNKTTLSAVSISLVIILVAAGVIAYRYRWVIRWRYYQLCHRRWTKNNDEIQLTESNVKYSAYVIYAEEDDISRNWVMRNLVPEVENHLQKPQMFIQELHQLLGTAKVDEVIRGIMMSHTAIWIICPAFFQCKMCEIASRISLYELGTANNLCVILDNRMENYSSRRQFQRLVNSSHGIRCVTYTNNEEGRRLFWDVLDDFIPALI